jgi:hypothetical protein
MTTTAETVWRVRVALPGGIFHLVSRTEPVVTMHDDRIGDVRMDLVTGTPESGDTVGDTIGFIDWSAVIGVTWRLLAQGNESEAASEDRPRMWRAKPVFSKGRRRA